MLQECDWSGRLDENEIEESAERLPHRSKYLLLAASLMTGHEYVIDDGAIKTV